MDLYYPICWYVDCVNIFYSHSTGRVPDPTGHAGWDDFPRDFPAWEICFTVCSVLSIVSALLLAETSNGPEIGPAFSSFFKISLSFCWKPDVCHMSTIILVVFGTASLLGSTKNLCFYAVGTNKSMLNTLKKRYVWMVFAFRHNA